MRIRQAQASDIPRLVALQTRLQEESAIWGYGADSQEDWAKRPLTWSFMAVVGEEPIGFIHCCPRAYEGECVFRPQSRILEIVDLFVVAEWRRRRVGRDLVDRAIQEATEDGFTNLRLYSASKRFEDVLAFYKRCGFRPWCFEMTMDIRAERGGTAEPFEGGHDP